MTTPDEMAAWMRDIESHVSGDVKWVMALEEAIDALTDRVTVLEGGTPIPDPEPIPEPSTYMGDILPYLSSAVDVTIPAGTYSIGPLDEQFLCYDVQVSRPVWAVIRAETRADVIVDGTLNHNTLRFGNGRTNLPHRALYAGIVFRDTTVRVDSAQLLSFWQCDFGRAPDTWLAQAEVWFVGHGYGGDPLAPGAPWDEMATYNQGYDSLSPRNLFELTPSSVRIEAHAGACRNIRLLGCQIGPSTDDGIFAAGVHYLTVEGCKIDGTSEVGSDGRSVDPGPVTSSQDDQFHNDAIQLGINGWRTSIVDSWLDTRIMANQPTTPARRVAAGGEGWGLRLHDVVSYGGGDGAQPVAVLIGDDQTGRATGITYLGGGSAWAEPNGVTPLKRDPVSTETSRNPAMEWWAANPYSSFRAHPGAMSSSDYRPTSSTLAAQ